MKQVSAARLVAFVAIAVALIAVALALGRAPAGHDRPPPDHGAVGGLSPSALRAVDRARRHEADLRVAGMRFLAAFLRYEVGELTSTVRARLQAGAAPDFAAQLLASRPRPPAEGFPPAAVLSQLARRALAGDAAARGAVGQRTKARRRGGVLLPLRPPSRTLAGGRGGQ